jgi:hypothetical protein
VQPAEEEAAVEAEAPGQEAADIERPEPVAEEAPVAQATEEEGETSSAA